jgi:DNA polymerase elongation subunit (family B)
MPFADVAIPQFLVDMWELSMQYRATQGDSREEVFTEGFEAWFSSFVEEHDAQSVQRQSERKLLQMDRLLVGFASTEEGINDVSTWVVRFSFKTLRTMRFCLKMLKTMFEKKAYTFVTSPPRISKSLVVSQFCAVHNIPISGWRRITTMSRIVNPAQIKPLETVCDHVGSPLILAFDLEVFSSKPASFPDARRRNDVVYMASMVFFRYGESTCEKILLTLGNPTDVGEDIRVVLCKDEPALLHTFMDLVTEYAPTLITGYNIMGFDLPFYFTRWDTLRITSTMKETWKLETRQTNELYYRVSKCRGISGKVYFDMCPYARKMVKLPDYKLSTVAAHHLDGSTKDPITLVDLQQAYRSDILKPTESGNVHLGKVGHYCVQDSVLVMRLFNKMNVWAHIAATSSVTHTRIVDLFTKGQQVRVVNQVYRHCMENRILCNRYNGEDISYVGGRVMSPTPGFYTDVVPFDFKSLYPTVMIAYNICYTTFIPKNERHRHPRDHYMILTWTDEDSGDVKEYAFIKREVYVGVIPGIITNLLDARAKTRKRMKTLPDDALKAVLNCQQLAYKVSANAQYGTMGVKQIMGMLPAPMCAETITAMGRRSLMRAERVLQEQYDCKVVYQDTDSCYVQFPSRTFDNYTEMWSHCEWIEKDIVARGIFPSPMVLEFESQIYAKFMLFAKKKEYCWMKFDKRNDAVSNAIESKGGPLARRNISAFTKHVYTHMLEQVFAQASFEEVQRALDEDMSNVFGMQFADEVFRTTVEVSNTFASKTREELLAQRSIPPHVHVFLRMASRGVVVSARDRVPIVITTRVPTYSDLATRMESYDFQQEHRDILHVDYAYYVKECISPVDNMLKVAFPEKFTHDGTELVWGRAGTNKTLRQIGAARKTYIKALSRGPCAHIYATRVVYQQVVQEFKRMVHQISVILHDHDECKECNVIKPSDSLTTTTTTTSWPTPYQCRTCCIPTRREQYARVMKVFKRKKPKVQSNTLLNYFS